MCDVSLKGLAKTTQSAKLGPPTKTRPLKEHFKTYQYRHPPFPYHVHIYRCAANTPNDYSPNDFIPNVYM